MRAEAVLPLRFAPHSGRTGLVAIGKAGADMARVALERMDAAPDFALAVTPGGHAGRSLPDKLEVVTAAHPHPDARSLAAGRRALELAGTLCPGDRLIALVSGGGSALLCALGPDLTLADKRDAVARLHKAGAAISDINAARIALSAVKGGRLGAAAGGARVETFIISDVPGDDPALVASGPTVPSDLARAGRDVLRRYGVLLPNPVQNEPLPDFPSETHVVATADTALRTAAARLARAGYRVRNLGGALEGDAAALGRHHARLALDAPPGSAILSGGETTVTLPEQPGRGGRNTTYLLSLAIALDSAPGIHALAADTDGIDGSEPVAGAVAGPGSLLRMRAAGVDPHEALARADPYTAFKASGDLLVTGPTLTNVNDLRVILVD